MRIARIVSDGTCVGTHVFLENGEELKNITKIEWSLEALDVARITIAAHDVQVDLVGGIKDDPVES